MTTAEDQAAWWLRRLGAIGAALGSLVAHAMAVALFTTDSDAIWCGDCNKLTETAVAAAAVCAALALLSYGLVKQSRPLAWGSFAAAFAAVSLGYSLAT